MPTARIWVQSGKIMGFATIRCTHWRNEASARLVGKSRLGFYPLPLSEAERIRKFLMFPDSSSAIDPCVGDGVAFEAITSKAHLISVLGGDSDVGAIWAAVVDQDHVTVEAPGTDPLTASLAEGAQCFRRTISIAGRKPIRHLGAVSAELAKTRPGMDPEGKRTILFDNDPTFMLYRIAQRYGLPVVPEWAGWFKEELIRHGAIRPLVGVGCSPVLVRGTKKLFLNWVETHYGGRRFSFRRARNRCAGTCPVPSCQTAPSPFLSSKSTDCT
jgi:hypothetical protein